MEKLKMKGLYEVEAVDIRTGKRVFHEKYNVLCQFLITSLFQFLDYTVQTPDANTLDLNYMAIGDGDTGALRADTVLDNEVFRKTLTFKGYDTTIFTAKLSIDAGEGNPAGGIIREVGIFANGTATVDTGDLISRAVVSIPKNSNIKLLITWTLDTGA